jgi:hypothetical protein
MKINFLFPNKYKTIGWIVLLPSLVFGLIITMFNIEPAFLDWHVPAIFMDEFMGEKKFMGMTENNVLNEMIAVLIIVSGLLVAFSKEKIEDEYISKTRLESLVWATYLNYGILIVALLFVFDMAFFWVMIFNMFTLLIFFIVRFNYLIFKLNKTASHEE